MRFLSKAEARDNNPAWRSFYGSQISTYYDLKLSIDVAIDCT